MKPCHVTCGKISKPEIQYPHFEIYFQIQYTKSCTVTYFEYFENNDEFLITSEIWDFSENCHYFVQKWGNQRIILLSLTVQMV